jgi:hypothetical protein
VELHTANRNNVGATVLLLLDIFVVNPEFTEIREAPRRKSDVTLTTRTTSIQDITHGRRTTDEMKLCFKISLQRLNVLYSPTVDAICRKIKC